MIGIDFVTKFEAYLSFTELWGIDMINVYHLNCGILHAPPAPQAACHCLLIERAGQLMLVDTGIGLLDIALSEQRIGRAAIEAAGFQFHEPLTALRQIERLGFRGSDVTEIVLTHGDPDHAGGLADFPAAKVHVAAEELAQILQGCERYSLPQFAHRPHWIPYPPSSKTWFGLEARHLDSVQEAMLIPLFGHTLGHCGVAIRNGNRWILHVGDAYYLRIELSTDEHPVSTLAAMRAENNELRTTSLNQLRRLHQDRATEVEILGYHDFAEFPSKSTPLA